MIKIASRLQTPVPPRASREQRIEPTPVEPPVSPEEMAETALLAIQVAAWEVEDTQAVLAIADGWIAQHGSGHRQYEQAVTRRRGIESRWCIQQRVVWTACCQLWHALGLMMAPESWIAQHVPQMDVQSVEGIWRSVMGARLVPFGVVYPVAGALPVPAWTASELSERSKQQRMKVKRKKGL